MPNDTTTLWTETALEELKRDYGAIYEGARILNSFRENLVESGVTFNPGVALGGTEARPGEGGPGTDRRHHLRSRKRLRCRATGQ